MHYEKGGHARIVGKIARLESQLCELKKRLLIPEKDEISETDEFIENIVGMFSWSSTDMKWECETRAEAVEILKKLDSIKGVKSKVRVS